MIKKTLDNYSLSDKQKDELFQRIENSLNPSSGEQVEKEEKKRSFLKYASVAAAILVVTGVTALVVHLTSKGEPINVSTPQSSTTQSDGNDSQSGNSSDSDNSGSDTNPLHEDPSVLPFYKDSTVMDMEPQEYGSKGMEQVRFAEKSYEEYRFVVAGSFTRREEDKYEAKFSLYIYKDEKLISAPCSFDLKGYQYAFDITKADMEQFDNKLMKIHTVWQDNKAYPLITLTNRVDKQVLSDLFYSEDYEYGTIFFSVKDDQAFRFTLNGNFNFCYPDFEMESFSRNVCTDKNGWVTQFDFENKTARVDAVFYDDEKQELLDSLLPFEDSSIPVYDGSLFEPSKVPYADVLVEEKNIGDYTFTLAGRFIRRSDDVDNYFGGFRLIVSKNGKAIKGPFIATVDYGAQGGVSAPKNYNYKDMLKCYMMEQYGIEYPLAIVTYNIPEEDTRESLGADSLSRFFTVRNGVSEPLEGVINYKNLSPNAIKSAGLSIKDSANRKRITFDFENRKATVTEITDPQDIDVRQLPYYKDSAIYKDGSTAVGESEFVRFAEKEYVAEGKQGGNYKFIVGGKIEKSEDGAFNVSLDMYLYRNDNLVSVQNALSDSGFDFTVSGDDIEDFGDTVLDLKEFEYFSQTYPLAVVTAKPHSSILEDKFPSAGFTTVSNFFTVRATNISIVGAELALFYNGGMFYPDYTRNVTFREPGEANISGSVMIDEKGWEVFFNPETLTAHITADKAYNVSIGIKGENYANKNLVMRRYPLIENEDILFTTDSNGKAHFDSLLCGTYIITDEEGNNIIDDKSESITITFDNGNTEITVKGKPPEAFDTTAENVTLQFSGDSSYTNRGLLYLIKTDKAFLESSEKLTYTDKDLSVVPSYSVSADGKIILDSADVGYYIVTGPMFLPTNSNGFTVFEITSKDDNHTINIDLNKADINSDRVGMKEPEQVNPDDYWPDGMYEFCMQDITFKNVTYSAISISAKWEQLENADGAYPYVIKGDTYEEEIHRARKENYSESCEIYYNGIIYTGKEVYDNFLVRDVMPYYQPDYRKTILYIRKDLKTEGNDIYAGNGFRSVNYGHDDVALRDIKLKVEGIDKKPEDFHDVWVVVLNELEVYMHRNNLNVNGYTDNFHYYDFVDGLSINENCELVVPEDYPHFNIHSGYTVIGVTHFIEDEYGSHLEFEDKLPVYLINSDGSAEFSFWIEKNMFG